MKLLQDEITQWADLVFPDRTIHNCIHKLTTEEFPEFLLAITHDQYNAAGEIADVLFLMFDIANFMGVDIEQAVRDKLMINKTRDWEITPSGVYRHMNDITNRGQMRLL